MHRLRGSCIAFLLARVDDAAHLVGEFALNPQSKECNMNTPVVLITGALTGIGRATALAFAEQRSLIVISGRHEVAGQELASELRALAGQLLAGHFMAPGNDDKATLLRERESGCTADAGQSAGDQDNGGVHVALL